LASPDRVRVSERSPRSRFFERFAWPEGFFSRKRFGSPAVFALLEGLEPLDLAAFLSVAADWPCGARAVVSPPASVPLLRRRRLRRLFGARPSAEALAPTGFSAGRL